MSSVIHFVLHVSRLGGKQKLAEDRFWANNLQSFNNSSGVQKRSIWLIFMHAAAIICTSFSLFFARLSCHLAKNSKSNVKIVLSASIKARHVQKSFWDRLYLHYRFECECEMHLRNKNLTLTVNWFLLFFP